MGKLCPFIAFLSSPGPNETNNKINITKYSFSHVPVPPASIALHSIDPFSSPSFCDLSVLYHAPFHTDLSVSVSAFITLIAICREPTRLHWNLVR